MRAPSQTETSGIPLPAPSKLSEPFWAGTRANKLLLQHCQDCGAFRWTPQVLCRACLSPRFAWDEVSGKGTVFSYTVVHRAPLPAFAAPYVVAVVELAEGPLMLTNVVDCAPGRVSVGMPVQVVFEKASDAITLYKFRPL